MAKKLELRTMSAEEERELRKRASSRTAPVCLVQRAKVRVTMLEEPEVGAMEAGRRAGFSGQSGCAWVKRFNPGGLAVLEDAPRGGRPPTPSPEVRSQRVSLARKKPRRRGAALRVLDAGASAAGVQAQRGGAPLRFHNLDVASRGGTPLEATTNRVPRRRKARSGVRGKKGVIIRAYTAPPEGCRVIGLDELGPLSAKTYPGEEYVMPQRRATFEPNDGRRGVLWVHGAFEPTTGEAALVYSQKRDGASHIRLLEPMITAFPSERWLVIEDNLSTHHSRDVKTARLAWPEIPIQFLPK